jgi:nucleoside-diphosphate-sugar epimerase
VHLAITGASGFVGGHVLRAAVASGMEGVAVVRKAAAAAQVPAPFRAVQADLEKDALARAFAGAAVVVHLAHIGSERDGHTYQAVNVDGTRAVVQAARAASVPRVIMFSGLGVGRYGLAPRVTDPYFRSKREAEDVLFASGLEVVVFRPSYVLGPGEGFVPSLLRQMRTGVVELPGDGSYRMQPAAVEDAAAAVLAAAGAAPGFYAGRPPHRVFDLVGPEPLAVRDFVERVGAAARAKGAVGAFAIRSVPVAEADGAAAAGGWHGMAPDELDCLLCDEVSDPAPLTALLGRPLTLLPHAIARTLDAALAGERQRQ